MQKCKSAEFVRIGHRDENRANMIDHNLFSPIHFSCALINDNNSMSRKMVLLVISIAEWHVFLSIGTKRDSYKSVRKCKSRDLSASDFRNFLFDYYWIYPRLSCRRNSLPFISLWNTLLMFSWSMSQIDTELFKLCTKLLSKRQDFLILRSPRGGR